MKTKIKTSGKRHPLDTKRLTKIFWRARRERERERTKKNEKENKNVWTYVIHTKVETENDRSRIVPLVSLPTCKGLPTLTRDKQVTRGEGGERREERGHGGADHT